MSPRLPRSGSVLLAVPVTPVIAVRDATVPVPLASDHRPVVAHLAVTRGDNS